MDGRPMTDRAAREGELFRLLAENVQDYAIFVIDPEGRVRSWSQGAMRLLGYREDEILGQPSSLFFTPEDNRIGAPQEVMREALGTGRGEDDRWHIRKDGTRFWCSGVMTPLRDEGDKHLGFAKIIRDRTDWWHAVQDRREGEARNAAILEAALDCIITIDHQGNVVEFNPAAERTFGYARSEALGREMTELIIPPSFRDEHRRGMARFQATGIGRVLGSRIEVTAMRADGTELLVEVAITRTSTGGSPSFTAFLRDITERRRQELEIAELRRLAEFGKDVALALTGGGSLGEMLARTAEATVRHLDGAFARIWTADEAGDLLEFQAGAGIDTPPDGPHARISVGQGEIGRIALERRPLITSVVEGPPVPAPDRAGREGPVAFAGYPLVVEDRLVGVWALSARHALSKAALEAMASVADGIAGGIERKQAEGRLRQQREWLQVTLASIGDAVISTDDEGRVRSLNPVAEGLTGWSQGEAAGKPIQQVFRILDKSTRGPAENPVDRVLRERGVVGLANHTVLVARDGTETAIKDSAAPIKDALGKAVGVVIVFQDATERRRHESDLEASRRFLASSLDALTSHIAVLDEDGTILMVNEAWRRFAAGNAYPHDDGGVGKNYLVACGGGGGGHGEGGIAARGIEGVLSGRAPLFELEYPCHGPDERRWFLMRATRFESAGSARAVIAHENLTERKRAEEQLRAAKEEAEHANRAKDQFLAVLSHELRTPLNPILLAATAMLERPPAPDEMRPALEMIRQNVNLQARLIDDLLDVMRIVRGKMPLHWEVADAHALIRQAVMVCQSEVFGKGLRLIMDLGAKEHHLNADPARFQQVIWNLVKNAVKFTPGGGAITIRTRNVDGVGGLVVEVADTGIGIESEVLPLIYDPFQQGETRITRKFGGLGLGLAICRGIVESHGGMLTAQSEGQDRGTTFRVALKTIPSPAVTGGEPADDSPRSPPAAPQPLAILMVEDEPATRRLMARLLGGLGHRVTASGTIFSALEALEAGEFDLIVSDIGLPDGSGLDLMRQVVARRGPVPAIALTGYGMEEDILRSREAGFTAHMTKPIDFAKLEAMIRQVIH